MNPIAIIIQRRADDHMAHVEGDTKQWEAAKQGIVALGKLVNRLVGEAGGKGVTITRIEYKD